MSRALWKHLPVRTPRVAQIAEPKTYARRGLLGLDALYTRVHAHNGFRFVPLVVTEHHLGFKIGSFAATRRRVVAKKRARGKPSLRKFGC